MQPTIRILVCENMKPRYLVDPGKLDLDIDALIGSAQQASVFLKALAHEARMLILCLLIEEEKSVTEIEEILSLRQPAISQQLARLRADGLVETRREGKNIFYSLARPEVREIIGVAPPRFLPGTPRALQAGRSRQSLAPRHARKGPGGACALSPRTLPRDALDSSLAKAHSSRVRRCRRCARAPRIAWIATKKNPGILIGISAELPPNRRPALVSRRANSPRPALGQDFMRSRVTPSAVSEHFSKLIGCAISMSFIT